MRSTIDAARLAEAVERRGEADLCGPGGRLIGTARREGGLWVFVEAGDPPCRREYRDPGALVRREGATGWSVWRLASAGSCGKGAAGAG